MIVCFLLFVFWQVLDAPRNPVVQDEEVNEWEKLPAVSEDTVYDHYAVVFDLGSSGMVYDALNSFDLTELCRKPS